MNATGTHTLTGAVTVTNDLTITAGTLDVGASNYTLSVGGDWSNSGTFDERSGKVKFTGTGDIGAETFYALLEVNASGTHTLTGAVTVTNVS